MLEGTAKYINTLARFCGKRDVAELTPEELYQAYGIEQADVMVLFGGSILCGGDVLAQAMEHRAAKKYVIVGGTGHTTDTLRAKVQEIYPDIQAGNLPEAQIFAAYLRQKYGLEADYLECCSTNCGNNITFLLDLLEKNDVPYKSIILSQDATMQRRMEAGLRKYAADDVLIINYAAYSVNVLAQDSALVYDRPVFGMWDTDRYISLLLGEIPRLSDSENGYGPKGKDFIAHVDIPAAVKDAYRELCNEYPTSVREANPLYASAR